MTFDNTYDISHNSDNSDYYIAPKRYYDKVDGCLLTASQALKNCRFRLVPFGNKWLVTEVMLCDRPKFNGDGYGLLGTVHKKPPRDYELEPLTPEETVATYEYVPASFTSILYSNHSLVAV